MIRWRRVTALALILVAVPGVVAWNSFQVDRDLHKTWMLLSRARQQAMIGGPVKVLFTDHRVTVEDRSGKVIESRILWTLDEVRFTTTQGTRMIVFTGGGGQTSPYNIHLHGGDFTFQAWTGYSRSIWIHCSGGMSEGRNDDWTLNPTTPSAVRF
jgi:hypothetical protein